jgi:TonB-dependent receptor
MQPRASLLLADKFLDGNLGLMANLVYDDVFTRNDYSRETSWNLLRDWDFSPEKTVISRDPTAAAVTTLAGCTALPTTVTPLASLGLRADCQRQFSDYAPRNARYGIWTRDQKRTSAELTAQYRFLPTLTAWGSFQQNRQSERLNDRNFGTDLVSANRLFNASRAPVYNAATGVPTTAGACVDSSPSSTPAGMTVTNHQVTAYTVGNCIYVPNAPALLNPTTGATIAAVTGQGGAGAFSTQARDFSLIIKSRYESGGFNYKNDLWRVDGLLSNSRSDYESQSNSIVLTQNAPGLVVTLDGQHLPHFTFPAGFDPESNNSYVQAQLAYRPGATFNTERQGKLDFQRTLDNIPLMTKVWFGVQGRKSTSKQWGVSTGGGGGTGGGYIVNSGASPTSLLDDTTVLGAIVNQTITFDPLYTGSAQRANDPQPFVASTSANRYVNGTQMANLVAAIRDRSPGTFFKGYDKISNIPTNWMMPNYKAAEQFFDASAFNYNSLYQGIGSDGRTYPQIPVFDVGEKVQAGYVRLDWGTEVFGFGLDGNFGVRYARTEEKSAALYTKRVQLETSPGSATSTISTISQDLVSIDNKYTDVLPSFNATLEVIPNKFLTRVGWAKVMARPPMNLLAPIVTCTLGSGNPQFGGDGTDDCTATNPDLKPYRATKYDLSFEYYPTRDSQFSLALFRSQIDTYILSAVRVPGLSFFNDGKLYDVTLPINGNGARTQGVELAARQAFTMLPGWLGGFGADVNYTRMYYRYSPGNELINPLDGSVLPYPGMSKWAYNVGLWYDRGIFNARIAYNSRARYYTGTNDVSLNPNFRDKTAYLDAKAQVAVTSQLSISIEGKNLTDQAELTYSGDLSRPNELAFSGRRYYISASYKF